jgi:transposase
MTYTNVIQRARVHMYISIGYSLRQIAKEDSLPLSTVAGICKKYANTNWREQTYLDSSRSGRPSKLTPSEKRNITRLITTRKLQTAVDVQAHLEANEDIKISAQTVRNVLKKTPLIARIKVKKPYLSAKHRRQRMEFANKYKDWTVEDWRKVIWSDESKFEIFGSRRRQYYWKRPGEQLQDAHIQQTVKHNGGNIMVWGCMTSQGIGGFCQISGSLDGELYRKILDDDFMVDTLLWHNLTTNDIIFQQDNDPKHTAKLTKQWFVDNKVTTLDWPAQSPDLNPIEHLWDEIDRRLRRLPDNVTGKLDLWEKIQSIWNDISIEDCLKLIDTMPQRIQAILKAKGGHTKW